MLKRSIAKLKLENKDPEQVQNIEQFSIDLKLNLILNDVGLIDATAGANSVVSYSKQKGKVCSFPLSI